RPKCDWIDGRVDERFAADDLPFFCRKGLIRIPAHRPNPARLVIARNPAMTVNREFLLIRNDGVSRKQKLSKSPIVSIHFSVTSNADEQTVFGFPDGESGSSIEQMIFCPQIGAVLNFLDI